MEDFKQVESTPNQKEFYELEKLKLEIENEKNKKDFNLYDLKKIKQETSIFSRIMPLLQIISSLGIIILTFVIGYNNKFWQDKSNFNDLEEKRRQLSLKVDDSLRVLQNLNHERKLYALEKEYDSLKSGKNILVIQNKNVKADNDSLKIHNNSLKTQIITTYYQLDQLKSNKNRLLYELKNLKEKNEFINEEAGFRLISYNIELAKSFPNTKYKHTRDLINYLASSNHYRERIIDSLNQILIQNDSTFAYGLSYFILIFGTHNEKWKKKFFSDFENLFSDFRELDARINFTDILIAPEWSSNDREIFAQIIIKNIDNPNLPDGFKAFLLNVVADMQNSFETFDLYKINSSMYLKYLRVCRKYFSNSDTLTIDKDILRNIAIICPQLYVSFGIQKSKDSFDKLRYYLAENRLMKDWEKFIEPLISTDENSLSDRVYEKIYDLKKSLDVKPNETMIQSYNKNKARVDFWLNESFQETSTTFPLLKKKLDLNEL